MDRATNWIRFTKRRGKRGLLSSEPENSRGIIRDMARKMVVRIFCKSRKEAKYKSPMVNPDFNSL
jgi:hypothetical protein